MKVKQVTDASFKKYGKILTGIDFSEILQRITMYSKRLSIQRR